jgi:hypothetical protein
MLLYSCSVYMCVVTFFGVVTFFRCFIWACHLFSVFHMGMCLSPFRCFIWTCVVTFSHVPLGHVFVTFSVFHLDMCLSTFSHVPLGHVFVTFSPFHSVHPLLTNDIVLFKVE